MKYTKFALLFAISLWFANPMLAQNGDNQEGGSNICKEHEEANEYYDAREYAYAAEMFKEAYTEAGSRSEKAEITFKLAECYRHMQDYKSAERQYGRAYNMNYGPICLLRQGDMLKNQAEYDDAIEKYQDYRQEVPGDPRGEQGIRSSQLAVEWMDNPPTRYQVTNLGRDVNSKEQDFSPVYAGKMNRETESLFFCTMREEATGKDEDGWTQANYSDIFMIEQERRGGRGGRRGRGGDDATVGWSAPVQIDGEEEIVNTPDHEGPAVFDKMQKEMYFTRCAVVERAHLGCAIYTSKRSGPTWMAPEPVVVAPDSTYSVGHPALSDDDKILYFAGDLPGSKGGRDLWMTTYNRRERKWNDATNLGSIVNTEGDELFPVIHDDGYLYFASNGLPGMGGLDIFRVLLDEEGMPTGEVENMKYPINSPANDYSLIFEPGGETSKGYLTSNWDDRDGSRGSDDIYEVYLVPLQYTISGVVTSTKDRSPVSQATVTLSGGDAPIVVNTDNDGYYQFDRTQLEEGVQYTITYEKKKFFTGEASATTIGVPLSAHELVEDPDGDYYIHNVSLNSGMDPIEIPIVLPNILFATGSWDLNENSQHSLDTVVDILNRNPNVTIELRSHTDYTDGADANMILSQHRADTCVKYLISKGIDSARLTPRGRGEEEPFVIPEDFKGLYSDDFEAGQELKESWVKSQSRDIHDKANQLNRRTDMKVLRDDYVPAAPAPGAEGEVVQEEASAPVVAEYHEVQPRESFGRIASAHGITVRDLKELNGGLRGVRPMPGMIFKVTPGADYSEFDRTHYQVERGDDWDSIAEKLGMDEDVLEDLNPDITEDDLAPGLYINIE